VILKITWDSWRTVSTAELGEMTEDELGLSPDGH
jgi:hypothetical protein